MSWVLQKLQTRVRHVLSSPKDDVLFKCKECRMSHTVVIQERVDLVRVILEDFLEKVALDGLDELPTEETVIKGSLTIGACKLRVYGFTSGSRKKD